MHAIFNRHAHMQTVDFRKISIRKGKNSDKPNIAFGIRQDWILRSEIPPFRGLRRSVDLDLRGKVTVHHLF